MAGSDIIGKGDTIATMCKYQSVDVNFLVLQFYELHSVYAYRHYLLKARILQATGFSALI